MNRNLHTLRKCMWPARLFCTKVEATENEPIKFSTSEAAKRIVRPVVKRANQRNMPWYQPYSVLGSVTVFMLYFFYFREENDLDAEFTKTLYDRVKGMEKQQLLLAYKFNKEQGLAVAEIETRLKELEIAEEAELVS